MSRALKYGTGRPSRAIRSAMMRQSGRLSPFGARALLDLLLAALDIHKRAVLFRKRRGGQNHVGSAGRVGQKQFLDDGKRRGFERANSPVPVVELLRGVAPMMYSI
jgi:hypothetical protein